MTSKNSKESQPDDARLSSTLREWRGIEPQANFDQKVWQRIRAESVAQSQPLSIFEVWRQRLAPHPVWVNTLAAMLGLLVGLGLAFPTAPTRPTDPGADALLNARTVAGAYVRMTSGALP